MSLTPTQKQLVQVTFQKVVPIAATAADIFYTKLFEYDPSLKPLFKGDMTTQGDMLMTTLGVAVKGLDNLDTLVPVLEGIATKHLEYGVKIDDYTPVGNALLYALSVGLEDDFTPEVKQAWVTVYKIIADVMRSAAYPDYDSGSYQNKKQYNH